MFHGLGLAVALYLGTAIDWPAACWCQVVISATQLMTHYGNEYFDLEADIAVVTPTRWSGGSGVLPSGLVPPRAALAAALLFGGAALVAGAQLASRSQAPIQTLAIVGVAVALAWSYSSPPLWLNRRGLGEITGAILVPGLTAVLGFQAQVGAVERLIVLAVAPLCCFQFAMLLGVNFPDAESDAQVNKRTLVVQLGVGRASRLFEGALVLGYLVLIPLVALGLPWPVGLAVVLTAPIAAGQLGRIGRGAATDPARWDALGFWSIGLIMATAMLETATFYGLAVG